MSEALDGVARSRSASRLEISAYNPLYAGISSRQLHESPRHLVTKSSKQRGLRGSCIAQDPSSSPPLKAPALSSPTPGTPADEGARRLLDEHLLRLGERVEVGVVAVALVRPLKPSTKTVGLLHAPMVRGIRTQG